MNIDKALKREKKYKKIFFITMIFLIIFLPLLTYLSYIKSLFILCFLCVIEVLIFLVILIKIDYYKLEFKCENNKLRFKSGIFQPRSLILCDKVVMVHTYKKDDNMEIILITSSKNRNSKLRIVTREFIKSNKEISQEYLRIEQRNKNSTYYYQVIKKGSLNKYILLDTIYRNCVNAIYTSSAIENIKIARGQNEI